MTKPRTTIYIDGFSLYYRALKDGPFRWLNLETWCQLAFPGANITSIKYFTAKVHPVPGNQGNSFRQEAYLRALRTLKSVSIHYGFFLRTQVKMKLVHVPPGHSGIVEVHKIEEKGSDVALGAHLVHDAHTGQFETAVLVSNDSDLAEAMKLVIKEVHLPVGVLNPCLMGTPSSSLKQLASFYRDIRKSHLRNSQFPDQLKDEKGLIIKPDSW